MQSDHYGAMGYRIGRGGGYWSWESEQINFDAREQSTLPEDKSSACPNDEVSGAPQKPVLLHLHHQGADLH